MRRILLSTISILVLSLGYSQDGIQIKVSGDNTDYSSGHSPYTLNVTDANDYPIDLEVTNNTGSSVAWRLIRDAQSDVPSSWQNAVCFGSLCFPPSSSNPYCTPQANTLNLANGATGTIYFHIAADVMASGTYKVYFGNDCTNFADSITIVLSYTAGLKDVKQAPSFSMHPNPSNESVTINVANSENGTVKLVDLLGNVIYSNSINNMISINTSDFKNGVYFVTVEANGLRYSSRKLIVRH